MTASGDYHYDTISAFIKSIRGSDPDAALYWMALMLEGGEDPKYIARRLIVHAAEDVGMADPNALSIATAAASAVDYLGLPEARILWLKLSFTYVRHRKATAPKLPSIKPWLRCVRVVRLLYPLTSEIPPILKPGLNWAKARVINTRMILGDMLNKTICLLK